MKDKPDPRLLRLITERDELKRQLRVEKIRAANLRVRVQRLTAAQTQDAAAKPEHRPSC